ncbi:hypothetical protein ACJMK2_021374 [Sinanodonta woodiana]|uniref:Metaxin-2 n=1 Tax=Sinanodonta woodiana TaxID=1069815 RepID=A0ABD3THD5_SINWO
MASLVAEAIQAEIGATERWPDNARLFQPYQVEQITFPDYAACLSIKTLLHMCGLKFKVELRANAEEMSPSGKVPFLQLGAFLISEVEPIIAAVKTRGFHLSADLTDIQKSELKAYIALIDNVLVNAELYLAWLHPETLEQVTKPRYGSVYCWPLNLILPWRKQREVKLKLVSLEWADRTMEEVCEEVHTCCQALSERLEKQQYFFGSKPTELDAVVFGHLYTLITTELPNKAIADVINKFQNLVDFCTRVDQIYFKDLNNDY